MIGTKIPGMDMISFGPTIENPHSPSERILFPPSESLGSSGQLVERRKIGPGFLLDE
jgi:hypothetical protein